MARRCFLVASLAISSLECSLDLMRPSLASWPHICAAASVTSLTHLEICHVGLSNIIFHLSVDCVWQENFGLVYGVVRKPLHKCFKCWWLAIRKKKTITKPLIESSFYPGLTEGPSYPVPTII